MRSLCLAFVALLAGCASSPAPASLPPAAAFGAPHTLAVRGEIRFGDGLQVLLEKIDDSRCPADVQCVWAGELAPVLRLRGGELGDAPQQLQLGTERKREARANGYRVVLRDASATTATIVVDRAVPE